ncbi:AAA family ATPase [Algibacter mikhailovii]|uniref:LuxR family transcriptional regulator n=1 Tax=Algibacter mikhailovii TaxID=425498 RepID=A0A918QVJ7_9FLAO|nr:AAA family ATPase [Algibacter mikhailovii]GGZ72581.1 hypothetical protein GCM10007028_07010 [Algibacter mikhailovii]
MKAKKRIDTIVVQQLNSDIKKQTQNLTKKDCFIAKTANQWIEEAKSRPIPNMLFGEMWYEGEVCILFADTNTGKSILAVQIADSISKGLPIYDFSLEVSPQKTVYFDFELSDKQFEKRYSNNYKEHYSFSNSFIRAEINTETEVPKEFNAFEDYLVHSLYQIIKTHNPKVIIIDNITYLKTDNERAKDALSLMKQLKAISKKCNISILVLSHTPKRDSSKPITKNDLAGSKMLINFCDSAFAIGESTEGASIRYIKQIKQRNTESVYHANNIAVFGINQDFNFLKFEFIGYDEEVNHLTKLSCNDKETRNQEIIDLHQQGLTNVNVAQRLGVSEGTVRYQLNKLK